MENDSQENITMNASTNHPTDPQARTALDYVFVELTDDYGVTFIGKRRDLNADTVELCTPDGRPVLQAPRHRVTSITREKAAELLHQEIRHQSGLPSTPPTIP
jgi:hypothetical protein